MRSFVWIIQTENCLGQVCPVEFMKPYIQYSTVSNSSSKLLLHLDDWDKSQLLSFIISRAEGAQYNESLIKVLSFLVISVFRGEKKNGEEKMKIIVFSGFFINITKEKWWRLSFFFATKSQKDKMAQTSHHTTAVC